MRGFFFHGEDQASSRQALSSSKRTEPNTTVLEITPKDFTEKYSPFYGRSLLANPQIISFEFFEKGDLRQFDLAKFEQFLTSQELPEECFFWFGFEVAATTPLAQFLKSQGFKETKFSISPKVFKIIDSFFAIRGSAADFYKSVSSFGGWEKDGVFLVQMLVKRVRQILWQVMGSKTVSQLHPFVRRKLKEDSSFWTKENLAPLYERLLILEREVKSQTINLEAKVLLLYEDCRK